MGKHIKHIGLISILLFSLSGCPTPPDNDYITGVEYMPIDYDIVLPSWFEPFSVPPDNPLTIDGVALGRHLFYDPILSAGQNTSCNSCHQLNLSFTDGLNKNIGDQGNILRRSSMSLINLAYNDNGYCWDGRIQTLEQQAISEIESPLVLNGNWEEVLKRLQQHSSYPQLFKKAFGIEKRSQLSKNLISKAIAQFERTLISSNSKYDKVVWANDGWFSNAEERGKVLFFDESSQTDAHPGCSHCHNSVLLTDNTYRNNGLDNPISLLDFADGGRGEVTGIDYDNGKFSVPTLRNIALTAPYMHDGRFTTLEDVLNHYSEGGHGAENEDVEIRPFFLTAQQKTDLISFLKTFTDTSFTRNENFKNPR